MITLYDESLYNKEILENSEYDLSEEEINSLHEQIENFFSGNYDEVELVKEAGDYTGIIGIGLLAIAVIIGKIKKWYNSRYKMHFNRTLILSKKIDDLYLKVKDLIEHDKMKAFKTRNFKTDYSYKTVFMKDSRNPSQNYYLNSLDFVEFDPEYFIQFVDEYIRYANQNPDSKKEILDKASAFNEEDLDRLFHSNYEIASYCYPIIQQVDMNNIKLWDAVVTVKKNIETCLNNIKVLTVFINNNMVYIELLHKAYDKQKSKYGMDKDEKDFVENVFKKAFDIERKCFEFTDKATVLYIEALEYMVTSLEALYDTIRKL